MAHRIRLCFLVVAAVGISSSVYAQWSVVRSFGAVVRSIYFLNQQGAAADGFVGLDNSAIWLTTNDGTTWSQASTPAFPLTLEITDFAFRDSLDGWCATRSNYATGEIWKTNDGGIHWDSCFAGGAFGSIGFCAASNTLVATCWTYGSNMSVRSTDFGATWTSIAPAWLNGVTFSGMNGFIGNISAPNPLYSTDGGATWNAAPSDTTETWSPHAFANSNIVLAVGEKTRQLLKSTNGGAIWTNPSNFSALDYPTGCIQGTLTNLFVQTQTNGLLYSSDSGRTWSDVCGPGNYNDTRFYPIGKEVFAADANGNLWHTMNGSLVSQASLFLGYKSLSITGIHCKTYDSLLYFGAGCGMGVLDSVRLISASGAFSLANDSVPRTFSSLDSIAVLYSPRAGLRDSAKVILTFVLDTHVIDTTITLYGTGRDSLMYKADTTAVTSLSACNAIDTTVMFRNTSCDTLTLWNTSIGNKPLFSLLPMVLPYKLLPGDSVGIPISVSPTQAGQFRSMLKFTLISPGFPFTNDSIPITVTVLGAGRPSIDALELSMLDVCQPLDTSIAIVNSECDSITLDSASLSDASIFHLNVPKLPLLLAASDSIHVPVVVSPTSKGTYSTNLHLRYESNGTAVDTTISISVHVLYNLPLELGLADSAFHLGTANVPCEVASRWITFSNSLCADLSIKRMIWLTPNSAFSFDPLPLPVTLASNGGVDSVLVHFQPNSAGTSFARLQITVDANGTLFDTVISISGTGVLRYRDSLLTPSLQYDSAAECLASERVGELVDLTCDSVIAISARAVGSVGYSLISPTFPQPLHHGDTLHLLIQLQPTAPGAATDFAIVRLHDIRNDSDYFDTIQLSAYVIAGRHALSLNSGAFSLPAIAPCTTPDSSLIITNLGCDDVIITDTTLTGYAGIEFVPPLVLPLTIAPDSSVTISFRVLPNRDTLERTMLLLSGTNINDSIEFTYVALAAPPALTFSLPDSNFTTRPCVPVTKSFWIANTGCAAASVDSIVLSHIPNASQFTLTGLPAMPKMLQPGDTLAWSVTFNPDGNGTGSASLTIGGGAKVRSIPLAGSVIGTVPNARIAIEADDGSARCSGTAGDTTSIVAVLLDAIGDTTALSTVTLTLDANWNLLTPKFFSAAPGWSVINPQLLPNGTFAIQLRHNTPGAVAAGTKLLDIACLISVADSIATPITLTNARFNASDSTYESCVLASIPMSEDPLLFTETDTCGTPELRSAIEHRLALKIMSVEPNPAPLAGNSARVTVTFSLAMSANVHFSVRDVIGREYDNVNRAFTPGVHSVSLEVPGASAGTYFIETEAGGSTANYNAMVQSATPIQIR